MARFQQFEGRPAIAASLPSAVVDEGAAGRALARAGAELSAELGQLADKAAATEGQLAALTDVQRQTAGFAAMRRSEAAMAARPDPPPGPLGTILRQAAARHGVSAETLALIGNIESGNDPAARNPKSSAKGWFQFTDATWAAYGGGDPFDAVRQADAAARLLADNAAALRKGLGREPTPAELYLAHQQGAGGALKLLTNPDARAVAVVGRRAVLDNGGSEDMTAAEFAALWLRKASGETPLAPLSAAAAETPEDGAAPALSLQPLQLRRDNTIRGDAYDAAALRAWAWRMQTELSAELAQAAADNAESPAGYEKAAAAIHGKYAAAIGSDPQARELFEQAFAQQTAPDRLAIATRHEQGLKRAEQAAVHDGIAAARTEIERKAYNLGANPAAEWLLQGQVARATAAIDAAVRAGSLTPLQGATARDELLTALAAGRVNGTFAALPTTAQKQAYALSLMDDWAKGEGAIAHLSIEQVKAMSSGLYARALDEANKAAAANRAEAARAAQLVTDDIASVAATGEGVDFAAADLSAERVRELIGPEDAQKWSDGRAAAAELYQATAGMESQGAADIAARLEALQPAPGAGFSARREVYEAAVAKARQILEARAADPLGQAAAAGIVSPRPLDFTTAEGLSASLSARVADARTVAAVYGTPLAFLQPAEKTALAAALVQNPAMLPVFAEAVVATAGEDATRLLAEVSDGAPVLAHAAGVTVATGDNSVAADVATYLSLKANKGLSAKMPEPQKWTAAAGAVLGDALAALGEGRAAVLDTARTLFELDANRLGFDPAQIAEPESAANAAWRRAIDRALGAQTTADGTRLGGLATVNGGQIVVPTKMPAHRPAELLAGLTDAALADLPPIVSGNGLPVTASQLRGARLVTVGDGLYRVFLGDPLGFDPQPVMGPDGLWTLDLRALEAAEAKHGTGDTILTPLLRVLTPGGIGR